MAESQGTEKKIRRLRYLGRFSQVRIYLGKLLRMFIYQNDWKVLPISAVIAGMVSMVIRNDFTITREGTLIGSLAFVCVGLWNGCFNSIQVICRERAIIKREHHSGMHIFGYTMAHVIFQAVLCLMQSVITVVVCRAIGVAFPEEGVFLKSYAMEFCFTLFLITFASDMMSLFISSLVHSTTAAMTIMPFVLIFQLIFSGGIFAIPKQLTPVSNFTISNYGIRVVAAEEGYNDLPVMTPWNQIYKMRDVVLGGDTTVGKIVSFLSESDMPAAVTFRETPITGDMNVGQALSVIMEDPSYPDVAGEDLSMKCTVWDVIKAVGYERARAIVLEKTSATGKNDAYRTTEDNILLCWGWLLGFAAAFTLLTMISLKFVDKDKR